MSTRESTSRIRQAVGFTSKGPIDLTDLEEIGRKELDIPGTRNFMQETIELFLRLSPRLYAAADEAVRHGDCGSLANACHKLKSQASYFGAHRLVSVCLQLEGLGLAGDVRRAELTMADLEDELDRVVAALQPHRSLASGLAAR